MSRTVRVENGVALESTSKTAPYDHLRRARRGELRHRDGDGLTDLLDDYFAHADEFELVGKPRAA